MLGESVPSIWASMAGWFTPAILFVLVNVVIGTIAVTSSKSALHGRRDGTEGNEEEDHPHRPRALPRSPSVLQLLRSGVNLYRHSPPEPHRHHGPPITPAPSASAASNPAEGEAEVVALLEEAFAAVARAAAAAEEEEGHFRRSQLDSRPAKAARAEEALVPRKLRKAASDVSAFGRAEDEEIAMVTPPPLTAREWRSKEEEEEEGGGGGGGEEVDAKADDFINRFRKQLQLQRVESILRNKQMQQHPM